MSACVPEGKPSHLPRYLEGLSARWSFTPISDISWKACWDDSGDKKIPTIEAFVFSPLMSCWLLTNFLLVALQMWSVVISHTWETAFGKSHWMEMEIERRIVSFPCCYCCVVAVSDEWQCVEPMAVNSAKLFFKTKRLPKKINKAKLFLCFKKKQRIKILKDKDKVLLVPQWRNFRFTAAEWIKTQQT